MSRPGFTVLAQLTNGKLELDRERMASLLTRLKDGAYDVTIEKHSKLGVQQRKYYFAVVVTAFAEYWGLDEDDAHDLLKAHCNKKQIEVLNKQTGEVEEQTVAGSTAGFTAEQWTLYIERCQRWGATDFGFVVPEPDKEWMFNAAEKPSTSEQTA